MARFTLLSIACLLSVAAAAPATTSTGTSSTANSTASVDTAAGAYGSYHTSTPVSYHSTIMPSTTRSTTSGMTSTSSTGTPVASPSTAAERAAAVRDAFEFAWDGYYKYCIGHDELHPVSDTCGDSR